MSRILPGHLYYKTKRSNTFSNSTAVFSPVARHNSRPSYSFFNSSTTGIIL